MRPRSRPAAHPGLGCKRDDRCPGRPADAAHRGPQRGDPDRAQAAVDQGQGDDGPGVHRAARPGEARGPAHRVPGGRLPQHLRVLGGPRGHLPHRRRPVHPPLRLLPDRHRQARRVRRRRAAPGGRVGAADGPALRHGHRRRPRRPARRRRVAVRRDGAADPRAAARAAASSCSSPTSMATRRCCAEVFDSRPEVLAHNVETVPRIFKRIRPGVPVRALARRHHPGPRPPDWSPSPTSSSAWARSAAEISQALRDLHDAGCELLTITQYLRPTPRHHPVERWVKPEEFVELREEAEEIGFAGVMSGPLVRSSYRAGRLYQQAVEARSRSPCSRDSLTFARRGSRLIAPAACIGHPRGARVVRPTSDLLPSPRRASWRVITASCAGLGPRGRGLRTRAPPMDDRAQQRPEHRRMATAAAHDVADHSHEVHGPMCPASQSREHRTSA